MRKRGEANKQGSAQHESGCRHLSWVKLNGAARRRPRPRRLLRKGNSVELGKHMTDVHDNASLQEETERPAACSGGLKRQTEDEGGKREPPATREVPSDCRCLPHCWSSSLCSSMSVASQGYITQASPSTSCGNGWQKSKLPVSRNSQVAVGYWQQPGEREQCRCTGIRQQACQLPGKAQRAQSATLLVCVAAKTPKQAPSRCAAQHSTAQRAAHLPHNLRHALGQLRRLLPLLVVDDEAAQPRRLRGWRSCGGWVGSERAMRFRHTV